MKKMLLLFCGIAAGYCASAQRDTIPVYFATGAAAMTEGIQDQLVNHIYNDVLHSGQTLQVVGYADYVGGNTYNDKLSKARANSVKRFLVQYGFAAKDITICIGKGEVEREGMSGREGFARDRRVDIVINPAAPAVAVVAPVPETPAPQPKAPEARCPICGLIHHDHAAAAASKAPDISKMKPNETVVLDKIYFIAGRHKIRPESRKALEKLYQQLKANPNVKIAIEGHVCCLKNGIPDAMDDDTHQIALSVNRAKAIYDYLVSEGIDKSRLSYKGFGATHRISEENTEEEADRNRRVELRIAE